MDASRSSSSSLCPGCGKALDPLRAGHVAILEGGFRYFCGAECKATYVDVSSKRITLEALTAEPPVVMVASAGRVGGEEPPRSAVSGVREVAGAAYFPEMGEPEPEPHEAEEPEAEPQHDAAREGEHEAEEPEAEPQHDAAHEGAHESDAPPATLRSTAREAEAKAEAPVEAARAPVEPGKLLAHLAKAAPIAGIACGALAFVVSLAGEGGASLRLPFALAAVAVVVGQALLRPRAPSEPARAFVVAPVVLAAFGAILSLSLHDPRAQSHAGYAGLAAAGVLLVDLLVVRARRDVTQAHTQVAAALAVRVRVVQGEATSEVDADHVKSGEQVVVEAGEVIGVDGIVAAGEAEIAPWFDSPVVLLKREGDAVVAGASIATGRLRITTTFAGPDRAWLKLGQTSATRIDVAAPIVSLARRTVERGSPIAALLVGGATYASNAGWPEVVIAASAGAYAAFGLGAVATAALAHARGHVAAQRRGIVYKNAEAFDTAARADVAVVCSRGTILLGEPEIVAVEAIAGRGGETRTSTALEDTARVLSLAAGAEMGATDALGAAILRAARARGARAEDMRSAIVHAGLGVTALAPNGDKVIVGSRAFLLQEKVSVAIADARVTALEAQGRSVLLVATGDRLVGLLALQDGLRPGARAAVQRLHDARIEPVLLSGEARDTCETIARALDIEHVRPEILPGDRGADVRALADGGRVVAAIGHPSSDDGALGAADVSVAMTAAGAAPGEWGVALASDDVRDAALALTVPRACREKAKTATLVAGAAQALSLLGIAIGVAPPSIVPFAAVAAAAVALALVREPATLPVR